MKKRIFIFVLLASAKLVLSQSEKPQPTLGLTFSGFVKTDILYDSRQTVNIREGHFLLFPKGEFPDKAGKDLNAGGQFNILSVQTRLTGKITGPDAFGAKTSGLIEGEFFGTADGDTNGFRLRHAYLKLNWKTAELLIGQFWHALFITDCFPDVVSFNTGAPFQPFSRAPQVRFTKSIGKLNIIATALSQRDFASNGPEGVSSVYLRNAGVPELNLKIQRVAKNDRTRTETLWGVGADTLRIVPRLVTEAGYKTDQSLCSAAFMAFFKHSRPRWTFKAEGLYGQNLHHLTMLGGYGLKAVSDPVRRTEEYAPLDTLSVWMEIQTAGSPWQAGVFGGYSKNLGARRTLAGAVYARGANIRDVFRIAPRLILNAGKLRLAAEAEFTSAAYGVPDSRARVRNARPVSNIRFLMATYYFF